MTQPSSSQVLPSRQPGTTISHLQGRPLLVARIFWLLLVAASLITFAASIPDAFAAAHIICPSAAECSSSGLTLNQARQLAHLGLSLDFYAYLGVGLSIFLEVVYVTIGVIIFWLKADDWMALLGSLTLVTFGSVFRGFNPDPSASLFLYVLALVMAFFGNCCIGLFFYLFPSGAFAPRWVRWLALIWGVYWAIKTLILGTVLANSGLDFVFFLGLLLSVVATQIYRYRRVSTPEQRRQTKWVVFGLSLALLGFLSLIIVASVIPLPIIPDLIGSSLLYVFLSLIPLSIGVAIMRSRLWDIDVIINRALVYGILTISLALIYGGSIFALQAILQIFLSGNQFAIVGSTLLIALLFQPLRRRIQALIDRRFYRRKYDAARTLETFSTTLQSEVDLNQLSEHLVTVIEETMQPECISLWLCKIDPKRTPDTNM
ncbi:hypothetical protein KSD_46770 [Ktedonobacter sp. SOSP1-85]|uniref:hypothetical protein n=1 Tax=Ktedonobacter sp. SOSP1-85 TaxID=2778367 RepID=UPI0019169EDC|nr:hypothetical protein [Ktedonobacter sp. SOSP1-85]GHO76906.1 hypothetical protein KSD_46770 [Ktedonobacter sp. SOSP1-85]